MKWGVLAEPLHHAVDLRAAAVHHHGLHAESPDQGNIAGEKIAEAGLLHRRTPVLDDNGLAVKRLQQAVYGRAAAQGARAGRRDWILPANSPGSWMSPPLSFGASCSRQSVECSLYPPALAVFEASGASPHGAVKKFRMAVKNPSRKA